MKLARQIVGVFDRRFLLVTHYGLVSQPWSLISCKDDNSYNAGTAPFHPGTQTKTAADIFAADTTLEELEFDGDSAKSVMKSNGNKSDMQFIKIDGGWRMHNVRNPFIKSDSTTNSVILPVGQVSLGFFVGE